MASANAKAVKTERTTQAKAPKAPRGTALKQDTLSESIYQTVRQRLTRGEVGPNDRVLDYEIAEEAGCTRMPVRQALLRLVNEGYLIGTTRGFQVPTLTSDDVRDIFEVRRLLEPSAAAQSAASLSAAQHVAMKRAYQKAKRAAEKSDPAGMIEANIEFRDVWLDAVSNSRLRATIQRFADHAQQVRLGTLGNTNTQKIVVDGLGRLLDAFVEHDAKQIRNLMLEFIMAAEQQYFVLLHSDE